MKTQENQFNPHRQFDSPREALEYCNRFPDPMKCFLQVLRANLELDEWGFSRELLDLWCEIGPRREVQ